MEPPISELVARAIRARGLISFAAGLVDEPSLPAAATSRACRQLLSDSSTARAALQYGTTQGLQSLRERLVVHLARLERRLLWQRSINETQLDPSQASLLIHR